MPEHLPEVHGDGHGHRRRPIRLLDQQCEGDTGVGLHPQADLVVLQRSPCCPVNNAQGDGRRTATTSSSVVGRALPARMCTGTPAQRQSSTCRVSAT